MKILPKILVLSLAAGTVPAYAGDFGADVRVGTTGLGLEAVQKLSPNFDLRFGMHGLGYSISYTHKDVDYDLDQSFAMPVAFLDWRPMAGKFRMSLGAAYYNNVTKLKATPDPSTNYTIGNNTYSGLAIGTLNGKVTYHTGAPYAGLGWDFLFGPKQHFGLAVDVGAFYRNRADVTLTSTGSVSAADLTTEADDLRGDLPKYHVLLNVGAAFRF